jgi:hypothetical protein
MSSTISSTDQFNTIKSQAQTSINTVSNKEENVIAGDFTEQQFYQGKTKDITVSKIPIVYGTVLTSGIVVDEGVTDSNYKAGGGAYKSAGSLAYKHYKIMMSEGDCNGIKANVHYHTIINNRPLTDPDTGRIELNGIDIKQKTETNQNNWAICGFATGTVTSPVPAPAVWGSGDYDVVITGGTGATANVIVNIIGGGTSTVTGVNDPGYNWKVGDTFSAGGAQFGDAGYTLVGTVDSIVTDKFSEKTKDISSSLFRTQLVGADTPLAKNITASKFLQGLADVSTEITDGFMLQYNSEIGKFEGKHINDIINEAGLFTTTDLDPHGVNSDISKWLIPHAISYTVTYATDGRATDTPFRWWKNGANAGNTVGADDSIYYTSVLKLDSLFRPDIIMYAGVKYTFNCSSLGAGNGFYVTSDFDNEYTTGVTSDNVAAGTAITENGTYTFTPLTNTPRIMYYRTQAASNTGGRILIRNP